MRVPDLNVRGGLDYGLVSRTDWYCGNPVIQVVHRSHERESANPAGRRGVLVAVWHEVRRRILWRHIVYDIGRNVV